MSFSLGQCFLRNIGISASEVKGKHTTSFFRVSAAKVSKKQTRFTKCENLDFSLKAATLRNLYQ